MAEEISIFDASRSPKRHDQGTELLIWIVLTLLVLGRRFLDRGLPAHCPSGILAGERHLLSLEICLNLLLFYLRFHFSDHLEELAFEKWSWMSVIDCPLWRGGRGVLGIQLAFSSNVVGDGNRFSAESIPIMSGSLLFWRHLG